MKKELVKTGFNKKDIVSFGNMFLLANGRYGYRGTLEEYSSPEMVGLNVLGFYDRYQDKWRESINLPNPFHFLVTVDGELNSILTKDNLSHELKLNIYDATLERKTEFDKIIISSTRFVSSVYKDLLVTCYKVKAKENAHVEINFGVDEDIHEINGPHYTKRRVELQDDISVFRGITNENKKIVFMSKYVCGHEFEINNNRYLLKADLTANEEICIFAYCLINQSGAVDIPLLNSLVELGYDQLIQSHILSFNQKWNISRVIIEDKEAQFELDYSIYHLLILADEESTKSIPARGLSGQTYKGAIFWDTEIFILPFFTLTNPQFARNLLVYRINTLKGAMSKAQEFGYSGAFYAWESQEDGLEQCSKYNVTDPVTNEPIRTYFDEKQIHISADIVLGIKYYLMFTGDYSILNEGGYEVIYQCAKFYMSRATLRNGQYHFDDVIGPDEYHERINDNAFTNYSAYQTIECAIKYGPDNIKKELKPFLDKIYLPQPNENGVYEQFDGYFGLEDIKPNDVKKMVKNEKEYLGLYASKTKTIKQADVVSLIVLLGKHQFAKENYDYYLPYTEHGSSLSSSMYSILASKIGKKLEAYQMFRKSSGIDLGTDQKMYAGGIYIGGTHPASNGGAYLSVVFGFAGLEIKDDKPVINPQLPDEISKISFTFYYKNKLYEAKIEQDSYEITEVINYD